MESLKLFLVWIERHSNFFALIVDSCGCVITLILTTIIIWQTGKLNSQQQALEKRINEQQAELQKRQLRLDVYPYKRELYVNVFAILSFCNCFSKSFTEEFLETKSAEDIEKMYRTIQANYVPDIQKAMWSLREAEYIFSRETAEIILDIRNEFDILGSCLISISTVCAILQSTGMNLQDEIDRIKNQNVHRALVCSKKILSYTDYIETKLPEELKIVDLDK